MLCRVPSLAVRGLPEAVGSRRAWWAPYRRGRKQDGGLGRRGRRVPGPTGLPPVACREGAAWRWVCRLGTGWSAGWTCGAVLTEAKVEDVLGASFLLEFFFFLLFCSSFEQSMWAS